jgi:hypothetical protein
LRRRIEGVVRRDYKPHRGALIASLGNLSALIGGLSLCTFGFAALAAVPLGAIALVLANRDLEEIRVGRMDPNGRRQTEMGRTSAIVGVILGLIIAAFFVAVYLLK